MEQIRAFLLMCATEPKLEAHLRSLNQRGDSNDALYCRYQAKKLIKDAKMVLQSDAVK